MNPKTPAEGAIKVGLGLGLVLDLPVPPPLCHVEPFTESNMAPLVAMWSLLCPSVQSQTSKGGCRLPWMSCVVSVSLGDANEDVGTGP